MKILITINSTWNIYNFRLGLLKDLMRDGHEIVALSPRDEYVERLEADGVKFQHIEMNAKGINPIEDFRLIINYFRMLKEIKPDVVLGYTIKPNIYATVCCGLLGIPVINNVSGLGTVFIRKSLSSVIAVLMYHFAFLFSSWVFFQNETDKATFLRYRIVSKKKASVLPGSGVNLEKFYFERHENKGKRFLFVGRLLGDKGVREFAEAALKLSVTHPEAEFQLVGEMGYNNKTAITTEELAGWLTNPRITYLGKRDDMKQVYEEADVMVLPSYREGTSKSLIEAAAMKLPIITTNVPGCKEVVDEGANGFLCKARNSMDLYVKMQSMTQLSESKRLEMGNYGRHKAVVEFDEKIVIDLYKVKINHLTQKI